MNLKYPIPLKTYLVKKLGLSNKESLNILQSGRVTVNGKSPDLHQHLFPEDAVWIDNVLFKDSERFIYLAYYKPRGIETTLNPDIPNNLSEALNFSSRVFPVGRLDKESEGLLLLTNDGRIFNKISHSQKSQEKEYIVKVDKDITEDAIATMSSGMSILGKQTRPSKIALINKNTFQIILTQGMNRQIRRMCYKLDYNVTDLKRIRIINLELGTLKPGQWRYLDPGEIKELLEILTKK